MTTRRKKQVLDEVHQAVKEFVSNAPAMLSDMNANPQSFEDALQAIMHAPRPSDNASIEQLGKSLLSAMVAAADDPLNWKMLALTIIQRRYHSKAPEAKATKIKNEKNKSTSGDGERLTFYLILVHLQYILRNQDSIAINVGFAESLSKYLSRLAFSAGGSRDICSLIEHVLYQDLDQAGILKIRKDDGNKKALCMGVKSFVQTLQDGTTQEESPVSPILKELIKVAANLVDEDVILIDSEAQQATSSDTSPTTKQHESQQDSEKMQSTINTFIPHNRRGSKLNARNLVQSIAELMIWSQTRCSSKAFSKPLSDITGSIDDNKIVSSVHVMQTAIRRSRQKLNTSARDQGFSLCTLFQMKDSAITLNMVRKAKEGDVTRLNQIASKAGKTSIVSLIAHRFADPAKAIPVDSMTALRDGWKRLETKDETDEACQLQLQIQEATVRRTINLLRSNIPEPAPETKTPSKNIVASLDQSALADGAAILVASALNDRCIISEDSSSVSKQKTVSLFIGEEECDISSLEAVMKALDIVFTKERSGEENNQPATTKHIQNVIERHVGPGENLLLFASSDVKLEQRVLKSLQEQKNTVHCHIIDIFSERLHREKAKVGDITATLLWDCEADLDIHAICPNGDHIHYSSKEGGGGYLDVDMNVSGDSTEPVENIFWGDAEKGIIAEKGKYKIYVQNYCYHGKTVKSGEPVKWRVRLVMDAKTYEYTGQCVGTGEASNADVVEFEYNGRTVPAPEATGSSVESSNLVSVTSSSGVTIDAISQLMKLRDQIEKLNRVRNLVAIEADCEDEKEDANESNSSRPLMAERNAFDVTSRDRLYLTLSKLPISFHLECDRCFEGSASLMDYTASSLAKRLIKDNMPPRELADAGYPETLVDVVVKKMLKFGI